MIVEEKLIVRIGWGNRAARTVQGEVNFWLTDKDGWRLITFDISPISLFRFVAVAVLRRKER